jgi:hypothetical protein
LRPSCTSISRSPAISPLKTLTSAPESMIAHTISCFRLHAIRTDRIGKLIRVIIYLTQ